MYSFAQSEYSRGYSHAMPGSDAVTQLIRDCKGQQRVMSNIEALSTLEAYRRTGDQSHRDRIVKGNINLITWQAHKFLREGVDLEDLVQVGSIGFMEGLDKFKFNDEPHVTRRRRFNYVLVFSRQKVASYALNYSRKRILLYLEEDVPNVKIGRRAIGSARQAMREMESFVRIHERHVPIDVLLAHKGPAERIGALDVYSTGTRQGTDSFDIKGHAAQPAEASGPTTEELMHDQRLALVCGLLVGEERRLVFSFYGLEGLPFLITCIEMHLSESEGRQKVRQIIARLAKELTKPKLI